MKHCLCFCQPVMIVYCFRAKNYMVSQVYICLINSKVTMKRVRDIGLKHSKKCKTALYHSLKPNSHYRLKVRHLRFRWLWCGSDFTLFPAYLSLRIAPPITEHVICSVQLYSSRNIFFQFGGEKSFHLLRAKCSQKRCETFVPMGIDLYLFPFFSWFITASSISLHDWYFSIKIVVVMIRMKITDLGINVRTKFSYINLIKSTAYLLLILFVDWQCSISIALKVKKGVTFSKTFFFKVLPH